MLKEYPKFKRGQTEEIFETLSKQDKELLSDYLEYRKARGITTEPKVQDVRRFVLQFKFIIQEDFKEFDLKDLRSYLAMLGYSGLSEYYKNNIKADLKNFLKYLFQDWSLRFSGFEDLRFNSHARNEEKVNASAMISKDEIDSLIKHENKLYWKAFLLTQYEGGLRTKECRCLKWEDLKLNTDSDITEVKVYATKTQRARTIFVKEATHWLNLLREEQENLGDKGLYIFHQKKDVNRPIDKSAVNMWFKRLTKRVLGIEKWNYLLRHSRATELYRLAKENKISKDTAINFMGHSDDMSDTYTHLDKKEVENMLKNQIYKIEDLPEERQHKLELEVSELKDKVEKLLNALGIKEGLSVVNDSFKEISYPKKK